MTVTLAHREDGDPDGPPVLLFPSLGTQPEAFHHAVTEHLEKHL